MSFIKTADDLRAALAAVPGNAAVLLILADPPRAAWLGTIHYDAGAHTLDLHDTATVETPGHGLLVRPLDPQPAAGLSDAVRRRLGPPTQIVTCPTCHAADVDVEWVGVTARYADHPVPFTREQCGTSGAGVGSHNLATARTRERTP